MLCLIMCKVRSENGYGFLRLCLKTGVGNGISWSEIGSGFEDAGGTPPPKIPRSTPPDFILRSNPVFCKQKVYITELLKPCHLGEASGNNAIIKSYRYSWNINQDDLFRFIYLTYCALKHPYFSQPTEENWRNYRSSLLVKLQVKKNMLFK